MTTDMRTPNAGAERSRILLVDDEPSILRSLKRTLRRGGHEVITAEGGAAGIDILEQQEIHLIICDQRMPDVPGPEVLAKAYQLQPDAFRITLTGHTDLEAAQKSINDGHVNQFLMKPWDDNHLRRCVEDGLRSYRLVLENRHLQELTQKQNRELGQWNAKLEEKIEERTEQLRKRNEFLNRLNDAMEDSLRDTVNLLASMLEMSHPSLGLHGKRVAAIAKRLGEWLELDDKTMRELEFASLLHEIGLVGAKPDFINDYGNATATAVRGTAQAGYRILSKIVGFRPIAEGVRDHAERYDGMGNRSSIKGGDLSVIARIIAVADAYDTAVFNRLDPTQVDRQAGYRILETGRNKRLDPELCGLMLDNLKTTDNGSEKNEIVEVTPRQIREGMVLVADLINAQDVLLAKAGTQLSPEMVHRVRHLDADELLSKTIRVYADPQEKAA
ncbi:MAG: HD domain-containing phosphohydrolase [Planctomycetota bacterium]